MSIYPDVPRDGDEVDPDTGEVLPPGRTRRSPRCSICGERGHRAPSCPEKVPNDLEGQPRSQPPKDIPPNREETLAQLGDIETQLQMMYVMFGQMWAVRDPTCGTALVRQAEPMAKSWVEWAKQDARVAKVLTSMSKGSGALGVVVAHLPFAMVVFQHHGPAARAAQQQEILEAQVKQAAQERGVPEEVIWAEYFEAQGQQAA